MPFPIAHALVGAAIADQVLSRNAPQRVHALCMASIIVLIPDFDFFLVWVLGLDRSWHRGFTHSILFALAAGGLLFLLRAGRFQERLAWTLALMSHAILDFLATLRGGGVELFWPISGERLKLGATGFFESPATQASTQLDALLYLAYASAIEGMIFLPLFLLSRFIRSRRAR
jgi:membrane-bound metal-dependent hydrolase YbcI (DUF457 family)